MVNTLIQANWDIFRAKFSKSVHNDFEWFCYLLFCREFGKLEGIFRYKNQAGIETEPIELDNHIIAWQAKFFDNTLSQHTDKIIDTLKKIKSNYPNVTKLIFYTNLEWSQSNGKKPMGLKRIEKEASQASIDLVWRTASFFESEFVAIDCKMISSHFFLANDTIYDLIVAKKQHTQNIMSAIKQKIVFNEKNIKIDRTIDIQKLQNYQSYQVAIISGDAGVGKTAIIKDFYQSLDDEIPFYIFKATEFDIVDINALFGNHTMNNFIDAHQDEANKIIVIDSAERLIDIGNDDPIKEFLSVFIGNHWKILFTTRNNYSQDLQFHLPTFYEIKNIENIEILPLQSNELSNYSNDFSFHLPSNDGLLHFICVPFFLNQYLQLYDANTLDINIIEFKKNVWRNIILKNKPNRSQLFINMAVERITKGGFAITADASEASIINQLVNDGILGCDEKTSKYFITHDIYEELALEKFISNAFIEKSNNHEFFLKIGTSLTIRRSFRNWLLDELLTDVNNIIQFIETVVIEEKVASFWKDEIFISILLSNYADKFFENFQSELSKNSYALLQKNIMLARLTCKKLDNSLLKLLGENYTDITQLKYVFTKPKGKGWEALITFIYKILENEPDNVKQFQFVIPFIAEWCETFKKGEVTKYAGLVALIFYHHFEKVENYSNREAEEKIIKILLNSSHEIKSELIDIFEIILSNKDIKRNNINTLFVEKILTDLNAIPLWNALPDYTLKLAKHYWIVEPHYNDTSFYDSDNRNYKINTNHEYNYFPASAFQTPIYFLLKFSRKKTLDFILNFVNETVEYYATTSPAKNEAFEVTLHIDNKKTTQYMNQKLWQMYRGTVVAPYLLTSIHMALEEFLLEEVDKNRLETLLQYLLINAKSASISSVVASVVMAYPDETFEVAQVLFKTKEFFDFDTTRLVGELSADGLNNIFPLADHALYTQERKKANAKSHRKLRLEDIFLRYQLKSLSISDKEFSKRQQVLHEILDNYYNEIAIEKSQSNKTKIWQIYLGRMDARKMVAHPFTDEQTGQKLIQFIPQFPANVKQYQENEAHKYQQSTKYTTFYLWITYKLDGDSKADNYQEYNENPKHVLKIINEIHSDLGNSIVVAEQDFFDNDWQYRDCTIDASVVLIRYYFDSLSQKEKDFCKKMIIDMAMIAVKSRGSRIIPNCKMNEHIFSILAELYYHFPEERDKIKILLLLGLSSENKINGQSLLQIKALWQDYNNDMLTVLQSYIHLRLKQQTFVQKNSEYLTPDGLLEYAFKDIEKIIAGKKKFNVSDNLDKLEIYELNILFKILYPHKQKGVLAEALQLIINAIGKAFLDNQERNFDIKHDFLQNYAQFILCLPLEEVKTYLSFLLDNFNASNKFYVDFFREMISVEDIVEKYDNFWHVWNLFKEKIIEISQNGDGYAFISEIISSYLFAQTTWKKTTGDWHSLKDSDKKFFKEMSREIGNCQSTLYAISRLLDNIGTVYLKDGISWVAYMLENNQLDAKPETIHYLEKAVRKFIYSYREDIKRSTQTKNELMIILDYLVKKYSIIGYMLRENIL